MLKRAEPAPPDPTPLDRLIARKSPAQFEFGLERIEALLASLGHPERSFRAIHVAGTNGKGSVAATAEAVLRAAGHRTGLYTSPHLVDFAERIVVDGAPADAGALEAAAAALLPLVEARDATFFEAATALAFDVFARSGVDAGVVEVGLGGRLDATNVLAADVAVVTSIALDHADYLGSDLAGIAREKAGIVAPGATLVLGDVDGDARRAILAVAADRGAEVEALGEAFAVSDVDSVPDGVGFTYRSERRGDVPLRLRSPLRGRHQAGNVAVAVAAADAFRARGGLGAVDPAVVARAVASVRWPGRAEVVRGDASGSRPTLVYDIAHNPAAAAKLADLLPELALPRPLVLLAAVLGDKDWRAVLGPLLRLVDDAVLTDAPSAPPERRWDLDAAAAVLGARHRLEVEPEFARALRRARELAGAGSVVITGSCHTVGDAKRAVGP